MGVRIIRGAIGSGKSAMCLDEIEKTHAENPNLRCVMIVPDHYSYETEKSFVTRFGGTGLNNIEVLTLRRMALSALSSAELEHLTDAGRQMLIYKAVTAAAEELREVEGMDMKLISSMKRTGFPDVAASLISEMKRYLVTPEELAEKAELITGNRTLKNKLNALSLVYAKYTEYTDKSGSTDSDDDMRRLAEHIEAGCGYDEETYVWIDRFDKFMPQQLCVIEALLKKGVHMTVSVCNPEAEDEPERELYRETEKTLDAVRRLADVYGFEGGKSSGKGLSHLKAKPDLYMLLRRWNEDFTYDKTPKNMALFQSRDTYSEVERIACKITDLVRGGGYRYRDIAMMCGSEDEYIHLVEAVFDEYEIPYFTDRKIILSDHPIAMQILSLFAVLDEDWSYESVFRYLRAGFVYRRNEAEKDGKKFTFYNPLDQNEIDILDNFVLRCGIRGKKRWLSDDVWLGDTDIIDTAFGDETREAGEFIDTLRREVAAPIAKFAKAAGGRHTAKEIASALFDYLEDINLYSGLKREIGVLRDNGMVNESEQFTKIWNLILDVLNQTAAALGNDKMTAAEYAEYMSVGLSKCEIRIIPSGIDQVYVGSAERISPASVKVMFVAGARSGTFPSVIKTEGFLSNNDRGTLKNELGITIAPDTKKKTDEQYFKVYRALCAVSDKLYFSYSIQDEEGKPQTASHMLLDIYRKFPRMEVSDNLVNDPEKDIVYISSPKATLHKLLINMSSRYEGSKNPLWDIVYDWYKSKEEWKGAAALMESADRYNKRGIVIDGDIAALLYHGKITYSASRINSFAHCPFGYFLQYGLGAKKREEWEITPANMGTYAHRVIKEFCEEVQRGAEGDSEKIERWRELSAQRRNEIISDIIERTSDNMLASNVRDKERTASILRRMGKTVSDTAALVQKSLSAGSYAEYGMEYAFETDITENAALRGAIDRIDTCRNGTDKPYMRIVDYKTGRTEFDVVNIFNGCDMQMVLYALAAKKYIKERSGIDTDVTGIYYTGVKSKYKDLNTKVTEENIKSVNEGSLFLDGVTFAGDGEDEQRRALTGMDNSFYNDGKSAYTKAEIDKNGELKNVGSLDEINGLMEYVRETLSDIDSRTRSGVIALNPYQNKQSSACDYCDYSSVCKFDEAQKTARVAHGSKDEIWEKMRTKGAAMKGDGTNGDVD